MANSKASGIALAKERTGSVRFMECGVWSETDLVPNKHRSKKTESPNID
jgi:hypothetical protein